MSGMLFRTGLITVVFLIGSFWEPPHCRESQMGDLDNEHERWNMAETLECPPVRAFVLWSTEYLCIMEEEVGRWAYPADDTQVVSSEAIKLDSILFVDLTITELIIRAFPFLSSYEKVIGLSDLKVRPRCYMDVQSRSWRYFQHDIQGVPRGAENLAA